MKTWLIILTLAIIGFAIYFGYRLSLPTRPNVSRTCPDEMIVNKMPGTQPQSSYYIVDGIRREISEFDSNWVTENCSVPVQEVY
jgi:hypothetical protein